MELFKITCVTCRSGLSVRNESLLGQIVACPKCGSMVQVSPPEPEAPVAEATSPAATEETSYAFVAWSVGGLAVAATLLGTVMLWPASPAVSDAASQTTVEQPVTEVTSPPVKTPEVTVTTVAEETPDETASAPQPPPLPPQEPVAVAKPQADVAPVEAPRVARKFDALELDPEGLDLATLDHSPEAAPTDSAAEPPPPPEPAVSTQPVVRRGADSAQNLSDRDAKKQFTRRLPALAVKNMPLADFLALMSQLGGVPVSVGSEHLLMAGMSPREPITLDVQDKTLDEVLAQALGPMRLEHAFEGPQVVIVRQGAEQIREIKYPVDDLSVKPAQLAEWIRQLVAPESWQTGKLEIDGDELRIEQSQRVHYQVLVFLERLRLVSGQLPRSKFPIQRLAPTPLNAAMAKRLSAPTVFTFSRETPLTEVFLHWQREIDVPLLIDWPALAEADLWPESTIVCAVAEKTWDEALSEVLAPLGLDWRATFGGAIEISSAEKLAHDPQLEIYPLIPGKVQGAAELKKQIGAADGDLIFHSAAQILIARQPASAQRQILNWLTAQKLLRAP